MLERHNAVRVTPRHQLRFLAKASRHEPSPDIRAFNSNERGSNVRLSKLSIRNFTAVNIPLAGSIVLIDKNW